MKRFVFFNEQHVIDPGSTCLRMLANFYGKNVTAACLKDKVGISNEAAAVSDIATMAESIGFFVQTVEFNFDELKRYARLPAILYSGQNHFIVLHKVKRRQVVIAHPTAGLMKLPVAEFRENWIRREAKGNGTVIALLLVPSPAFYRQTFKPGKPRLHPSESIKSDAITKPYEWIEMKSGSNK